MTLLRHCGLHIRLNPSVFQQLSVRHKVVKTHRVALTGRGFLRAQVVHSIGKNQFSASQRGSMAQDQPNILQQHTIRELLQGKGRLIQIPHSATVRDALQAMLTHNVLALPVAAPPGQWLGAGGSVILESDPKTGQARKQYIGLVSVLDVLMHLAEPEGASNTEWALEMPVSRIIGHSLEGLSLWTLQPATTLYDAMEPLCKGVHRVLVPLEVCSSADPAAGAPGPGPPHVSGVELVETAPAYKMLTQSDVMRFLLARRADLGAELAAVLAQGAAAAGAVHAAVLAVPASMRVIHAVRCMQQASVTAVAVVEPAPDIDQELMLAMGVGRRVIATFSASDLRGCNADVLRSLPKLTVAEFLSRLSLASECGFGTVFGAAGGTHQTAAVEAAPPEGRASLKAPVTCSARTPLGEVMELAAAHKVHRVWVTEEGSDVLEGVVTLSDIVKAVRSKASHPRNGAGATA
eukprot:jgi/Mesen1/8199/ME000442S07479